MKKIIQFLGLRGFITMMLLAGLMIMPRIVVAQSTVVDIIVNSPSHNTLETAVTEAGLVDALNGEGPFTVFAPTDDAFAALPDGLLDELLEDPSGALTDILLYHVVAAKALSTDLGDGDKITTLLGKDVTVTISNGDVFINDAQVIVANLEADNGVVHVIDAVLVPEEVSTAINAINFSEKVQLSIYPNPSKGDVNISFQLDKPQNVSFEIYTLSGQKIIERNLGYLPVGKNTVYQTVNQLKSGSYFVYLRIDNERTGSKLQIAK